MKSAQPRPYVFARVLAFDVECPSCGTIAKVRGGGRRWRSPNFNPVTRRLACRSCRRLFAVGLAIWRVARTGNRPGRGRQRQPAPMDCQPKPEQLAALRSDYGLVRQPPHRRATPINLIGCPCLDREDVDPACPFHSAAA